MLLEQEAREGRARQVESNILLVRTRTRGLVPAANCLGFKADSVSNLYFNSRFF